LGSLENKLLDEDVLKRLAEKKGKTPAQCLISWGVREVGLLLPISVSDTKMRW
jgi:diketogulonate reductase-like aldo/keto reductase